MPLGSLNPDAGLRGRKKEAGERLNQQIIELRQTGMTVKAIGHKLRIPGVQVRDRIRWLVIRKRLPKSAEWIPVADQPWQKGTPKEKAAASEALNLKIIDIYKRRLTDNEMAHELKISLPSLKTRLSLLVKAHRLENQGGQAIQIISRSSGMCRNSTIGRICASTHIRTIRRRRCGGTATRPSIQAGSLQWPRIKPEDDDGVMNTHFAYMWTPGAYDSAMSVLMGNLPEMHVWVGIVDRQEVVDFTTETSAGCLARSEEQNSEILSRLSPKAILSRGALNPATDGRVDTSQ